MRGWKRIGTDEAGRVYTASDFHSDFLSLASGVRRPLVLWYGARHRQSRLVRLRLTHALTCETREGYRDGY